MASRGLAAAALDHVLGPDVTGRAVGRRGAFAGRALTPNDHPPAVLNDYAKLVAPLLVAAFPDTPRVSVDQEGELSLEIACPSGSVDAGLSVFTSNEDVVVAFHTHHAHFSDWSQTGSDDHIQEAMQAAYDVIAERWIVIAVLVAMVDRANHIDLEGAGGCARRSSPSQGVGATALPGQGDTSLVEWQLRLRQ